MLKLRINLFLGIFLISIFPIIVKLEFASALVLAFYRMAIAAGFLIPALFFIKIPKNLSKTSIFLTAVCGVLLASDIVAWNYAIQGSTATQATLLTNLSPIWVGFLSLVFLKITPTFNFWLGTFIAILGLVVLIGFDVFASFSFDNAFLLGILSGVLYAFYFVLSKFVLERIEPFLFTSLSTFFASVYLGILCVIFGEKLVGYSYDVWLSFGVLGLFCQLIAWLLIASAIKKMRPTRVSTAMLSQALFTAILASIFLAETITNQMIIGALLILFGIFVSFLPSKK